MRSSKRAGQQALPGRETRQRVPPVFGVFCNSGN
jgi:hypothetical protein